ncbi:MAG TPA: tetratricopeptide repeat protein [Acidobacteriaceae bacterium]
MPRSLLLCSILCALSVSAPVAAAQAPGGDATSTHLASAYAALQSNRSEDAAREFEAVLAADPANVEANANLGVLRFLAGDCARAEPSLRKALASDPNLAKAQGLLGICGRRLGEPGARALLESSFAALAEPRLRMQVGFELADLLYTGGEPEAAIPVAQELVRMNPESPEALFLAQRLYQEMADDTLNKLAVLAPDSARMQQLIAERLVNAGNLEDAIPHYQAALKADPHLPGMHFELAEALLESTPNDPRAQAAAAAELQSALDANGDNAAIEGELGDLDFLRENYASADSHYRRALSLAPTSVQALSGLAKLEMRANQPQQAAAHLSQAIELDPMNAQAHYRLALAYRALHHNQQPDPEAEQQMKLFKDITQARDRVAALYRQMNQADQPAARSGALPAQAPAK